MPSGPKAIGPMWILSAILRNVKGENRRQMIRDHWRAGKLDELDSNVLSEEVDERTRSRLGKIHPSFMGGEYMPGYLPLEVEIARICLQSTTSDVISLRARPTGKAIAYRVVDEYDATFTLPIPKSAEPLAFADIVRELDEGRMDDSGFPDGGLPLGYNNMNSGSGDFESLRHFTRISSDCYRDLRRHYEHVFEDWVAGHVAKRDSAPEEKSNR